MKKLIGILLLILMFQACQEKRKKSSIDAINWDKRAVGYKLSDSLEKGRTYLSVYPQIYSQTEKRTHGLSVTVSMRNTNMSDTIFIDKAEYFSTEGNLLRSYFDRPIFIAPLETIEIVIKEGSREGGPGANFLFDWRIKANSDEPFFEGIMISTSGQQGLSFTTRGIRIR